jgi:hypothetical protein
MTGEIIIEDSITIYHIYDDVYQVGALVMGANDVREDAKNVSILWNPASGINYIKDLLISTYNSMLTPPESAYIDSIKEQIGTNIPTSNSV